MRWIFMVLIFPLSLVRAQVMDDFTDGNFSDNPQWLGVSDLFRVDPASGMLQLYAPAQEGEAALYTSSQAIESAVWQFRFKMAFNPSSANYAKVYLAAQDGDGLDAGDAFYLVMGTTDDNISLWEQKGGISRKLINGLPGRLNLSSVEALVRVTRSQGGLFVLECNPGNGWVEEGRYKGSAGLATSWFGLSCHYTSTRSKLFYFDDFVVTGQAFQDTIPPEIMQFEVVNRYQFRLWFSKSVGNLKLNPYCFLLEPGGSIPDFCLIEDLSNAVDLLFRKGIPLTPEAALTVVGLEDIYGNVMADTTFDYSYTPASLLSAEVTDMRTLTLCFSHPLHQECLTPASFVWEESGPAIAEWFPSGQNCLALSLGTDYPNGVLLSLKLRHLIAVNGDTIDAGPYPLFYYQAARNDIVITELMVDPFPAVFLPESEYIELFNRGDFPVNLKGFSLLVNETEVSLDERLLFPDEYLLLVPASYAAEWPVIPGIMALPDWPALTNGAGAVVLRDNKERIITALRYHHTMGMEGFKQEGGWSLEVVDPDNLSGDYANWAFSTDQKGGTPGRANAVAADNPDFEKPELRGSYLKSPSVLVLEFSEQVDPVFWNNNSLTTVEPPSLLIGEMKPEAVFLSEVEVHFTEEMPEDRLFKLVFQALPFDWAGNRMEETSTCLFGWPVDPEPGQVVINELLFDPPNGGYDYLELFNLSDHLVDLSGIYVSRANSEGIPEKLIGLSKQVRVFPPKAYRVYSPGKEWILSYWSPEDVAAVKSLDDLPNYPTSEGTVFVTNISGEIFDRFDYSDKMHFGLLGQTKGVALERIDPEAPTQEASNWHSASATCNYGTPGMVNSQTGRVPPSINDDFISVEPDIFFPNQDGFQDLLFINYSFSEAGNTCTVTIFTCDGKAVRHLVNNSTTARDGFFTWDGLNDHGNRCPSGIYLVWARSFHLNGRVRETRKIAVLGSGRP